MRPEGPWVITKASRGYEGGLGYTGPSWEAAGLSTPSAPFWTYDDAKSALVELDKVNAVGWVIHQYRPEIS